MRHHNLLIVLVCAVVLSPYPALAQFSQQGTKLVGSGATGPNQGYSVSLSGDGNTAIIGGIGDNGGIGAAWVWTKIGGVWTQQGGKLVGSGAVGTQVYQGSSVSLSGDGNTAIVGGPGDNSGAGAVWIWTRSGGVWSQQGTKLVGADAVQNVDSNRVSQGRSVSISADGNTAIVGGIGDSSNTGAAWVWTRSGAVWTQQGSKLIGSGIAGKDILQGWAVSLSGDGNTAIVGGAGDTNSNDGAAWVWTRNGGVWTQQGSKLVGSGAVGLALRLDVSVSLSGDGNTAIVGGGADDSGVGAAWVWTRSGGIWTQQGDKLVGSDGTVGCPGFFRCPVFSQGYSVSLSADGNVAVVGAPQQGAWVWTRSLSIWTQLTKLVATDSVGDTSQGASVSLSAAGNTAIVGGYSDNNSVGAAWIFAAGAGTISVTTNLSAASFTITGPANYSGSGLSFSQTNAPVGTYTITYGAMNCYSTPLSETKTLTAGGVLTFSGGVYQGGAIITVGVAPAGATSATFSINPAVPGMPSNGPYPRAQGSVWPQAYTVTFNSVTGFQTPAPQTVSPSAACTLAFAGSYSPVPASSTATISVQLSRPAGGFIVYAASTNVLVGNGPAPVQVPAPGTYVVKYSPLPGFYTPLSQTVTLSPNDSPILNGVYRRLILLSFTGFGAAPVPPTCPVYPGAGIQYPPGNSSSPGMISLLYEIQQTPSLSPGADMAGFTFYSTDGNGNNLGDACDRPPVDSPHTEGVNWFLSQQVTQDDIIAVVGHSYGGNRARLFAEDLHNANWTVDYLATVDPIDWDFCDVQIAIGQHGSNSNTCNQSQLIYVDHATTAQSFVQQIGYYVLGVPFPFPEGYTLLKAPVILSALDHAGIAGDPLVHTDIKTSLVNVILARQKVVFPQVTVVPGTPTRTAGNIVVPIRISVTGTGTAIGSTIATASLNGTPSGSIPIIVGDIAAGTSSAPTSLGFSGTAAASGATVQLIVTGQFSYGQQFSNTFRMKMP